MEICYFIISGSSKLSINKQKYRVAPKKCIHSLLINIFGINLNEISISG